ncbi:MAG: DUF5777 family beta-barrel protein [Rhodothermales bacterium]
MIRKRLAGTRLLHRILLPAVVLVHLPLTAADGQDDKRSLEEQVAEIFQQNCAKSACHSGPTPQMGMDLTREVFHSSVVDKPSTEKPELKRIDPGHPETSYLVKKIKGEPDIIGAQMPLIGDRLTEDQVDTIVQWITELAAVDSLEKDQSQASPPAYPFNGWKVVNLPTSLTMNKGSWLFLIGHRFNPKISEGYDALYGLDGSGIIYLSLGYALTDDLLIAIARSNSADNVELEGRYRLAQQRGNSPIGAAAQVSLNWVSEDPGTDESRLRGEALKVTGQVSLTRAFGPVGVAVVPGITLNPAENVSGEDPLVTLGLGGRWTLVSLRRTTLSLVGEWVPIVSGYTRTTTFGNDIRFDSGGGGVEVSIGGHVFQIVISNSVGLTSDQYLRGGDLDIADGEMRLGFNIFRVLNF